MNGVDAVVLATGNDWRAMEAGAHAYAARTGVYRPLATWRVAPDGWLEGAISLPTAVGTVGGATKVHPAARLALQILGASAEGSSISGHELGQVMAAAGLASNLAALRAMATEGIQRGHMALHARSVAVGAGAVGPEVDLLTAAPDRVGRSQARASRHSFAAPAAMSQPPFLRDGPRLTRSTRAARPVQHTSQPPHGELRLHSRREVPWSAPPNRDSSAFRHRQPTTIAARAGTRPTAPLPGRGPSRAPIATASAWRPPTTRTSRSPRASCRRTCAST
jgi:hypothetical protein